MKWKLVPEEPTEEMGDAGIEAWKAGRTTGTYVDDCYKAMLAAAPQPEHDRMTKEEAQSLSTDGLGVFSE
jgi:hypothetical protein